MDDDRLFRAYLAGFEASSEGYNGEYVGRPLRKPGRLETYLYQSFECWRDGKSEAEADARQSALWKAWREEDGDV